MKTKEKKVNYLRIIISSIAVVSVIAASFMIPILIYISLVVLGFLVIWNMKRIENVYTTAEEVVDASQPVTKDELKEEEQEEKKEVQKEETKAPTLGQEEIITNYIKGSMAKGHKLKPIVDVLFKRGYDKQKVKAVCEKLRLIKPQPVEEELPDITKELDEEIEEKEEVEEEPEPKPKTKMKKRGKKKKMMVQGKMKEVEVYEPTEEEPEEKEDEIDWR